MQLLKDKLAATKAKFIFVSGGVISGLGKGTTVAALSSLLKHCGFNVFPIKVDMYLNQDAGTMNPLEHGETFVTEDGLECDQDLGTYERFIHTNLSRKNYFTAGQIYQSLLNKERQLKFNGACVEAFPHIPLEIIEHILRFPDETDIVIIEYGGTVGEYQNEAFFEAARIINALIPEKTCFIHVGYILNPPSLGEQKTKPMQMSIRNLNQLGIFPNILICRAEQEVDKPRMQKIAIAAGLPEENIFSCPNLNSIYKLPKVLKNQNILKPILSKLNLPQKKYQIKDWDKLFQKIENPKKEIKIGIIAKYYDSGDSHLADSYISVLEAIKHACIYHQVKPHIIWFNSEVLAKNSAKLKDLNLVDCIIVPQGWGNRGAEGKIKAIQYVREHKIPYLGLCYGMQMATIEFARNILGLKNANSEEVDSKTPHPVVHIMDNQKEYLAQKQYGGTIRLGGWPCQIKPNSLLESIYKKYQSNFPKNNLISERHRHRYEFNNNYREQFENKGFHIVGTSPDNHLVEAIELDQKLHPFFIATQFHPELISRPLTPHPIFLALIAQSLK